MNSVTAHSLLDVITEIQSKFIRAEKPRQVFDTALDYLLQVTGTEYGFIAEVFTKGDQLALRTCAASDISWSEETRKHFKETSDVGMEFTNLDNLFGEVVKTASVVMSNDPANDIRYGGLPQGHPRLDSFLGVPLFNNGELIGVAGVANRKGGFNCALVERLTPFFLVCGNLIGAYVRYKQKNTLEAELKNSQEQLQLALSSAKVGCWSMFINDDGSTEVEVDRQTAFLHQVSFNRFPSTKDDFMALISIKDRARFHNIVERSVAMGHDFSIEYGVNGADGKEWILAGRGKYYAPSDQQRARIIGLCWDITEKILLERELTLLAHTDTLTSLANRRRFKERLQEVVDAACSDKEPPALIFIDLDRFKYINDNFGHLAGDELLTKFADRISTFVRGSDLFARVGGDEFAILITSNTSELNIANLARAILGSLDVPFHVNDNEYFCAASVGITFVSPCEEHPDEVIKRADMAMQNAKSNGGSDYFFFCESLKQSAKELLDLDAKLHRALQREEFYLVFQPQVNISKGQTTGCEALLRWQNAELGQVSPDTFIPILEENRLILSIGNWVLDEAISKLAQWRQSGRVPDTFSMSINLSPLQLLDAALIDNIDAMVARTSVPYSRLCFEVTETVIMQDTVNTKTVLRKLRERGASVSMDDFGSGFTSLAYLCQFPINELKLDRAFISNIGSDKTVEAITRALIGLCNELDIVVVAEGVEAKCQLEFLCRYGCCLAQGYYFARPMPSDALLNHIEDAAMGCLA